MCVWRITAQSASAEQRSFYDVICKGLKEKKRVYSITKAQKNY